MGIGWGGRRVRQAKGKRDGFLPCFALEKDIIGIVSITRGGGVGKGALLLCRMIWNGGTHVIKGGESL